VGRRGRRGTSSAPHVERRSSATIGARLDALGGGSRSRSLKERRCVACGVLSGAAARPSSSPRSTRGQSANVRPSSCGSFVQAGPLLALEPHAEHVVCARGASRGGARLLGFVLVLYHVIFRSTETCGDPFLPRNAPAWRQGRALVRERGPSRRRQEVPRLGLLPLHGRGGPVSTPAAKGAYRSTNYWRPWWGGRTEAALSRLRAPSSSRSRRGYDMTFQRVAERSAHRCPGAVELALKRHAQEGCGGPWAYGLHAPASHRCESQASPDQFHELGVPLGAGWSRAPPSLVDLLGASPGDRTL